MRYGEKEQVDELLKLFPGPITHTPQPRSTRNWFKFSCVWAVLSLLLAYPGIGTWIPGFTRDRQAVLGLTSAVLAAFGMVLISLERWNEGRPRTIVLDADGFHTTGPNSIGAFAWVDVEEFYVKYESEGPDQVTVLLFESEGQTRRRDREYRFVHTYGFSAAALSSLLSRWCDEAWRYRNPPRYGSAGNG